MLSKISVICTVMAWICLVGNVILLKITDKRRKNFIEWGKAFENRHRLREY